MNIGEIIQSGSGVRCRYIGNDDGKCPGLAVGLDGAVYYGDPSIGMSPANIVINVPALPARNATRRQWRGWHNECMRRIASAGGY
jgi:hypothetical protein